jgi:chitin synthase
VSLSFLFFFWFYSTVALSESVFGYITVLPGAFSAYRYIALQNDLTGEGPLQKYFLGETMVCIKRLGA